MAAEGFAMRPPRTRTRQESNFIKLHLRVTRFHVNKLHLKTDCVEMSACLDWEKHSCFDMYA